MGLFHKINDTAPLEIVTGSQTIKRRHAAVYSWTVELDNSVSCNTPTYYISCQDNYINH